MHSLVYINPSPILAGHSLVLPKRIVNRLEDLSPEESLDLWLAVHSTSRALKAYFSCPALTIELKTGTPNELFVNLIPRRAGDLEKNDTRSYA